NGCGTHAIGTDARRPPWYFAPPECSGRALAALLNGRASYEQCFASLASHFLHGRGSSAFGRRPSAVVPACGAEVGRRTSGGKWPARRDGLWWSRQRTYPVERRYGLERQEARPHQSGSAQG